ncbi:MAG: mechanosensitive ion channel [Gammaproteobacteria bacterium]|nr:mechanosensitive ion channel [Gammaproteobacteria bacterium]MBU1482222.1 mechanosensitive ion channel [Gammaproteobacteria bacterium]
MSFWGSMTGFFWSEESLPLLIMVLCIAIVLLRLRREERASLVNTLGFFFICMLGLFSSGLLHALELPRAAALTHEVFIIGAGVAVIRLWGLLVFRIVLPIFKFTPPRITEDFFVIIAYIAWFMVRLRYAGLDLGSILATSAMLTAVVAFAMQDTLGNILGGLALQLDNSIDIGDWIKVDDISGKVVDIRWRSTLVETRNWETVVFPNSQLMKNKFLVLGRRTDQPVQWRRWVWFNVGMDTAPTRVVNLVEDSILQTDIANVAKDPAPSCILMDMDDKGYGRYALRYWLTDLAADDPTDAILRWHIMTALQRAGIKLAQEAHSIHLTKENEKYDEGMRQREVLLRIKTLRRVELFSQLNDVELRGVAERLRFAPFAKGNIITRQGDARSHWLYIIINGEAEVYVDLPNGKRRTVRILGRGNFFGEMGLLTGAPRSASVIAKTDVECYRIDKDVVEELLHARPGIAEEISHILVTRRAELDEAMQNLDATGAYKDMSLQRSEILATIKRFFSLG